MPQGGDLVIGLLTFSALGGFGRSPGRLGHREHLLLGLGLLTHGLTSTGSAGHYRDPSMPCRADPFHRSLLAGREGWLGLHHSGG